MKELRGLWIMSGEVKMARLQDRSEEWCCDFGALADTDLKLCSATMSRGSYEYTYEEALQNHHPRSPRDITKAFLLGILAERSGLSAELPRVDEHVKGIGLS